MDTNTAVRAFVASLVCATIAACAAQKPAKTTIVWQKVDGSPATREEVEAAASICAGETHDAGGEGTGRFGHLEWSVHMLECMKNKGYQRVERPVQEAP